MTTTGPATFEQLHELHRLVVEELIKRMKGAGTSAELLHVARAVMKDGGLLGLSLDEVEQKRLRELWDLYVKRIGEALRHERPSSAVLAEARQFLLQNGISKDLGEAIDHAAAMKVLGSLDLPFKTH